MISPILQMKILRLRGVKPDLQAKSKTLSERDLVWLLSSRNKGAGVGAGGGPGGGPFTRSSCSLSGGGASCQPGGLAAPGCPGKRARAVGSNASAGRTAAAAGRGRSKPRAPAGVRLGSPAPVRSPQGAGLQQLNGGAARTVEASAGVPERRASR